MLYYKQDLPAGTVISPTENANRFYGDIVPPIFIHDEYEPKITNEFIKRQKQRKRITGGESDIDNRACSMDDCLYDNDWKKDKVIKYFMNGRHWGIMFISLLLIGIPPNLRSNIDWVFYYVKMSIKIVKSYMKTMGMFHNFEMFCQTMDACTKANVLLFIMVLSQIN